MTNDHDLIYELILVLIVQHLKMTITRSMNLLQFYFFWNIIKYWNFMWVSTIKKETKRELLLIAKVQLNSISKPSKKHRNTIEVINGTNNNVYYHSSSMIVRSSANELSPHISQPDHLEKIIRPNKTMQNLAVMLRITLICF